MDNQGVRIFIFSLIFFLISIFFLSCNRVEEEQEFLMDGQQKIVWGDEVNALRLGILINKNSYASKEPITLEIYITNVSKEAVPVVETYILREHKIEVFTAANQPVPSTKQGEQAIEVGENLVTFRRIVVNLEPGEVYKVEPSVRLDEWFHLDTPGTYTVQVQRKAWQNDQGETLSSSAQFSISL